MTLHYEETIRDFDFWGGAEITTAKLTWQEWNQIEAALEGTFPKGMSTTELNDLFCFNMDYILALAGLPITEEELLERANE